jgi:hypothetical protein
MMNGLAIDRIGASGLDVCGVQAGTARPQCADGGLTMDHSGRPVLVKARWAGSTAIAMDRGDGTDGGGVAGDDRSRR